MGRLDLHADVHGKLASFVERRARDYARFVDPGPGEDDDPVRQITLGYQLDQAGWVALVFDTRPDAKVDGEWQGHLGKGTILNLPRWHKAFLSCVDREQVLRVVMPGGEEQTIPGGDEDAATTCVGKVLAKLLQAGFERGPLRNLPLADDVRLVVEEQGGAWGWRSDMPDEPEPAESVGLEALVEDVCRNQRELVGAGSEAVPLLLGKLGDPKHNWIASKLLGEIGDRRPEVLAALRKQVTPKGTRDDRHATYALALLGEGDALRKLARGKGVQAVASGLRNLYSSMSYSSMLSQPPLDFGPLERALDAGGSLAKALNRKILSGLSVGSTREPSREDVPEVLRALGSRHAAVRRLAASMLYDRVGKPSEVVPALVVGINDRSAYVRRSALCALGQWGKAARKYREEMRACLDDRSEDVVAMAKQVLARKEFR
ncbi:MAG: hypothetical protein JKY65_14715 [Planctomycetes bacterium]|nr:hypothetical protein [Planctomycetota bacterium]